MLVQLLGLHPPQQQGVNVVSKIAGAFTASGTSASLLFTLPNAVRAFQELMLPLCLFHNNLLSSRSCVYRRTSHTKGMATSSGIKEGNVKIKERNVLHWTHILLRDYCAFIQSEES